MKVLVLLPPLARLSISTVESKKYLNGIPQPHQWQAVRFIITHGGVADEIHFYLLFAGKEKCHQPKKKNYKEIFFMLLFYKAVEV